MLQLGGHGFGAGRSLAITEPLVIADDAVGFRRALNGGQKGIQNTGGSLLIAADDPVPKVMFVSHGEVTAVGHRQSPPVSEGVALAPPGVAAGVRSAFWPGASNGCRCSTACLVVERQAPAAGWWSLYSSRSLVLSSLPVAVWGSSSTNRMSSGSHHLATWPSRNCISSSLPMVAPSLSTAISRGRSCHLG